MLKVHYINPLYTSPVWHGRTMCKIPFTKKELDCKELLLTKKATEVTCKNCMKQIGKK